MASKQENISDYYEQAKEIARAEKELGIERWDIITICRSTDKEGETITLCKYDLPIRVSEPRSWVFRWRAAKYQCKYPRYDIRIYHSYYRKVLGENVGMQADINTFVAAKAQLKRQQSKLAHYIAERTENDMFYNEQTDKETIKAKAKLERKIQMVEEAEARLINKVKSVKERKK